MPCFIRELDYFILNRWAVARPYSFDLAAIKRRSCDAISKNLKGLIRCVRYITTHLLPFNLFCQERKRRGHGVALLSFKTRPIDGAAIQTWRRPRFQARPGKSKSSQLVSEQVRRCFTVTATAILHLANVR